MGLSRRSSAVLFISSQWRAPTRRQPRACLPPRALRASRAPRALRTSRPIAQSKPARVGAFDQHARLKQQGAGLPSRSTVRTGRISRLGRHASRAPHPAPSRQRVADAGGPRGAAAAPANFGDRLVANYKTQRATRAAAAAATAAAAMTQRATRAATADATTERADAAAAAAAPSSSPPHTLHMVLQHLWGRRRLEGGRARAR